jgi:hypothetical protein
MTCRVVRDIWFAPNPSTAILGAMMSAPSAFQALMRHVSVIKINSVFGFPQFASDATLEAFFHYLAGFNIRLAVDAEALTTAPGGPGFGVEGFGAVGDLATIFGRFKALGGTVSYVSYDEPWYFGNVVTGLSLATIASMAANSTAIIKGIFPNCVIGEMEPVAGPNEFTGEVAQIEAWWAAYKSAAGQPFGFFHCDNEYGESDWTQTYAPIVTIAKNAGVPVGAVINGIADTSNTDAGWCTAAKAAASAILSNPVIPNTFIVQSWNPNPSEVMDPTVPNTLAGILANVVG